MSSYTVVYSCAAATQNQWQKRNINIDKKTRCNASLQNLLYLYTRFFEKQQELLP